MSFDKLTDAELVQVFWNKSNRSRRADSLWGYRTWMLEAAPRLYKIMLDGLVAANPVPPAEKEKP